MRFESLHAFSVIYYDYEHSYYPHFAGLSDVVVTPYTLAACADETVTATCSVSDTTFLQWTILETSSVNQNWKSSYSHHKTWTLVL